MKNFLALAIFALCLSNCSGIFPSHVKIVNQSDVKLNDVTTDFRGTSSTIESVASGREIEMSGYTKQEGDATVTFVQSGKSFTRPVDYVTEGMILSCTMRVFNKGATKVVCS